MFMTDAGRETLHRAAPLHLAGIEHHFGERVTEAKAESKAGAGQRVSAALTDRR